MMNDPQASLGFILKPPAGFEALYQGQARSTPIALVPFVNGTHGALDLLARESHIDDNLCAYAAVAFPSTFQLILPRCRVVIGEDTIETPYTYELRWRFRQLLDWQKSLSQPYHLESAYGVDSPDNLLPLPTFTSEVIVPTSAGNGQNPLLAPGVRTSSAQGLLPVASQPFADQPNFYFPPIQRPCFADQLLIVAYRDDEQGGPTWDFLGEDAPFSNIYGSDVGGAGHPVYPALGAWLHMLGHPTPGESSR